MILGFDFDTRAVHAVLLDDDTNHGRYVPIPFSTRKKSEAFRFDEARDVEEAVREALCRWGDPLNHTKHFTRAAPLMDSVHLVGIEKPIGRQPDNQWKYGLVCAGILAAIPRAMPVLELPPNYGAHASLPGWKALCGLPTNASKDQVREWGLAEFERAEYEGAPEIDWLGWPQDAFDAYSIARAARTLNARGIAAA